MGRLKEERKRYLPRTGGRKRNHGGGHRIRKPGRKDIAGSCRVVFRNKIAVMQKEREERLVEKDREIGGWMEESIGAARGEGGFRGLNRS